MLTNLVLVTCEEKFTRCRPFDILRGIYRERVEISTDREEIHPDSDRNKRNELIMSCLCLTAKAGTSTYQHELLV
jgi:hypothetical protein